MKAIGKNVFILPDWDKEEMHGTLHLPQCRIRDLPNTGVVQAMPFVPVDFKVGDRVIYNRYKTKLTNVFKQTLAMVTVDDVLAVVLDKPCYLHEGERAADWLSIPCAPGGRLYICAKCAADPDVLKNTWEKYQKDHAKNIKVFKAPLNPSN